MSPGPLPLKAIHTFLVTARHLNLTRAAAELCITQGAVSRKIAALENWLGFALFERHARGLHLTTRGAALLPELREGFETIIHATERACGKSAPLRLKAPTCAMRWLVPKLVALEQRRPDIQVALTTTLDHGSQLEGFDAAIVYGAITEQGHLLFDEVLTPAMGTTSHSTITLDDLSQMTFLHPTQDSSDWQRWLQKQPARVVMARNQYFDTMDLAISAAIQGFGITIADITLIQSDISSGRLLTPFEECVRTGAAYSLLHRPVEPASAHLADLISWLLTV